MMLSRSTLASRINPVFAISRNFSTTNNIVSVFVLRHGETFHNIENKWAGKFESQLNERGFLQAKEAGQDLKKLNIKFDILITSTKQRTIDTANGVLKELDYEIPQRYEEKLIDEQDVGDLTNTKKTPENKKFLHDPDQKPPGQKGESRRDVMDRSVKFIDSITDYLLQRKNILVVTHSNYLKAQMLELTKSNIIQSIPNAKPFKINFKITSNQLEFYSIEALEKTTINHETDINEFLEDEEEINQPSNSFEPADNKKISSRFSKSHQDAYRPL